MKASPELDQIRRWFISAIAIVACQFLTAPLNAQEYPVDAIQNGLIFHVPHVNAELPPSWAFLANGRFFLYKNVNGAWTVVPGGPQAPRAHNLDSNGAIPDFSLPPGIYRFKIEAQVAPNSFTEITDLVVDLTKYSRGVCDVPDTFEEWKTGKLTVLSSQQVDRINQAPIIQFALRAVAGKRGGRVRFKAKRYVISNTISVDGEFLTLEGNGATIAWTTGFEAGYHSQAVIPNASKLVRNYHPLMVINDDYVSVSGLRFSGEKANRDGHLTIGLTAKELGWSRTANNLHIDQCSFFRLAIGVAVNGIRVGIEGCRFYDNGKGLLLHGARSSTVERCVFQGQDIWGLQVDGIRAANPDQWTFNKEKSWFETASYRPLTGEGRAEKIDISSCQFEQPGYALGAYAFDFVNIRGTFTTIRNCHFETNRTDRPAGSSLKQRESTQYYIKYEGAYLPAISGGRPEVFESHHHSIVNCSFHDDDDRKARHCILVESVNHLRVVYSVSVGAKHGGNKKISVEGQLKNLQTVGTNIN